jgi:hypothetical protein
MPTIAARAPTRTRSRARKFMPVFAIRLDLVGLAAYRHCA